jgi:hypothetical protein
MLMAEVGAIWRDQAQRLDTSLGPIIAGLTPRGESAERAPDSSTRTHIASRPVGARRITRHVDHDHVRGEQ